MNVLPFLARPRQFVDRLLKQHFFKPAAPQSLSLFRFLYCAALLVTLAADHHQHLEKFAGDAWHPIPLFELMGVGLMSPALYDALHVVLLAALGLAAVGACTRVAATIAWVAFFFYMGTYLGFNKSPHVSYVIHTHNIVVFVLFILSLAPGVATYGVDGWLLRRWRGRFGEHALPSAPACLPATAWPSQLIKLTLGLAYFGAGYCKMAANPLWADGVTLQSHLMAKHLVIDSPAAVWLAQSWWLCLLLGIATLALELTFFLIVFYPRLTWFYIVGAVLFHASIYVTMGINFLVYFGFTLLIFLDWPTLEALAGRLSAFARRKHALSRSERGQSAPAVCGDTLAARFVILGLWSVLAVCVYARIESWPFSDYAVFAGRSRLSEVRAFRLAVSDAEGQIEWVPRDWSPLSRIPFNRWMQTHVRQGDTAALARLLDELAIHVASRDTSRQFQSLVVVERTVQADPATGGLVVIDRPLRQATLAGGASRPAVEISERPLHTDWRY
jgi:hypothetical protein